MFDLFLSLYNLIFGIIIIILINYCYIYLMKEKKSSLPPLITSSSFLTNISKLTSTTTEPITFLHEVANTYSDSITPYGRLYRLSMPMFCHYIVTSDYKLARLVMEGDSSIGINEAEKTDIVRKFDYINKPSILS